jgi:hypothetical protein
MKALLLVQGLPSFAERAEAGVVEVSSDADTSVIRAHLLDWVGSGGSSALGFRSGCGTLPSSSLMLRGRSLPSVRGKRRVAEEPRF